ncbi:MAG: TetR/AcrR family transcriptional regulator C-terminal domain-containing protein [Thermomicrobiales bacterium]
MSPPDRLPLTRERIVATALTLIDTEGLGALTMRRLGQMLGVEGMALYNHLPGKDAIIVGAFDRVMTEVPPPRTDLPWKDALRDSAREMHLALGRHPWAASQMMLPSRISEARLAWMNGVLGVLRVAGCSAELAHHAFHVLESHIIGFSLWLGSMAEMGDGLPPLAERLVDAQPFASYPWLVEHMRYHIDEPHEEREYDGSTFELGLEMVLDGIESLLRARA